jgi:hypothetical protein
MKCCGVLELVELNWWKVDRQLSSGLLFLLRAERRRRVRAKGQAHFPFDSNDGMYTTVLPVCEPQVQSMEVVCPGNYLNVPISNN